MLAVAVLACLLLRDEESVKAGSNAVSGKIEGFEGTAPAVPAESASRAEEKADAKAERSGAARVKVLELARAAAENKARAEALKTESGQPSAEALETKAGDAKSVEAEALALLTEEAPAARKEEPAVKNEAPAPAVKIEATATAVEAAPAAPAKAAKKPEAKKTETRKSEVKKTESGKTAKKAEADKPARHLSAVESALADARSGRLAPAGDVMAADASDADYDRVITSAKFSMKGSLIKLTLRGNSPMVGHFYVLESPDRVVLDLAGNWKVDMPKVPSNRLIGGVRVGQHEDKTRLVFDMKTTGRVALVPLNRNALELRIQ